MKRKFYFPPELHQASKILFENPIDALLQHFKEFLKNFHKKKPPETGGF